ncbi:MAG TPA: hypothetical protein VH857_05735 [Actinomycetes bacterium]|jgi:hypothetical protein|nr:hypothetical protein [Actinomycetes bacterium]
MFGRTSRVLAATVTLAIVGLVGGAGAQSASAQTHHSTAAQSITNTFGSMKVTKVTGTAAHGTTFAGHYSVNRFITTSSGKTKAVGKLTGTLTKKNGTTRHVATTGVRMPVRPAASTVSGSPAATGTVAPQVTGCQILNLVLGPLDLNLLGLVVHLDQVHLNITAVPGAGDLLGNLLCAVAGLLDSSQLLNLGTVLTNLLNAILGILNA